MRCATVIDRESRLTLDGNVRYWPVRDMRLTPEIPFPLLRFSENSPELTKPADPYRRTPAVLKSILAGTGLTLWGLWTG
jgi:hypothetical protein